MVLEEVAEVVGLWERARRQLVAAMAGGDAAVSRSEARLRAALGGIPLERWRTLTTTEARVRDPRAARQRHQALRIRPAVHAALQELEAARASRDVAVRAAEMALGSASGQLASYRRLAEWVTGKSVNEHHRTARAGIPTHLCDGPAAYSVKPAVRRSPMAIRERVKDYQRRIARLDAAHTAAQAHLDAAHHRRAEVIAVQDEIVADAQRAVDEAAVAMAVEMGPELAASLLGRDLAELRRLVNRQKSG